MDTNCNWEQNILANEIIQGMEIAKQLKFHLSSSTSSPQTQEMLLQRILSSYDNALLILNWGGSSVAQPPQPQQGAKATAMPESPISVDGSPRIGDSNTGFKDQQEQDNKYVSKKRKALPTWTDQVRICSDNGIEGSSDDGFSWRKYGQKDILGAKYPRSYYRCTYRNTQTCWATKQVQRSDEDPAVFEITYKGRHTCHQASHAIAPPASPEKQEQKHKNHYNNHQQQQHPDENLFNLRANLRVNSEDLNKKDMYDPFSFPSAFGCLTSESQLSFSTPVNDNLTGGFSPLISPATSGSPFISPATSGTSYFSVPPYQINSFGQVSESDHTEIISANTTTTNSPIMDLDFSLDQVDLDPNFPFNTPGFFT